MKEGFKAMYTIKDLERVTGIKAHTIRIWEQRYDMLRPERTDTNIRRYDNDQLKKLVNVAFLIQHGWKVSKVAALSEPSMVEAIQAETTQEDVAPAWEEGIRQLVVAMIDMDESGFRKAIQKFYGKYGLKEVITQLIYPFLERVGVLWSIGQINPAQEHFAAHLVRQKLMAITDGLSDVDFDPSKKVILYLPDEERHEIGLLIANYLMKSAGYSTIYLGADVPLEYLHSAIEQVKPQSLVTFALSENSLNQCQVYDVFLAENHVGLKHYVCFNPAIGAFTTSENSKAFHSMNEFMDLLSV